ncbi:MAG: TlpA family protein disulfide reductase [Acidimicrobiales bacterium]
MGRRPHTALLVVAPVAIVVAFVVVVLWTREPATDRITQSPLLERPAPEIAGTTLDGEPFELSSLRGRFVVVNFFATWCVPCVQEHDDLRRFSERHDTLGDAVVVSVVFDDEPENVERFFEENGGDWPVVVGDEGDISLDYGVTGVPESYLVGPDGVVYAKITGGVTDRGLDNLLADVVGGGR